MNKETFLSLLPTEWIKEEDVKSRIQEQTELIEAGKKFASQFSINRYLDKPLTTFTFEEKLQLFSNLHQKGFVYDENALYFTSVDIENFKKLLKEKFQLEDIYTFDQYYVEQLLQGNDIAEEEIAVDGDETIRLHELFQQFVFTTAFGMNPGDTPNVMLMLVVKKALLGAYLGESNIASLQEGKREIYDISILK